MDIAIIGLSLRLPDVEKVEQFWDYIKNGEEVVGNLVPMTKEKALNNRNSKDKFIQANIHIKDIEYFDAAFFNFNTIESSWMDPQHRLFLEVAWEAMENSGYGGDHKKGLTGVYAGVYANYYSMFNLLPYMKNIDAAHNLQMQIASEKDHVATMVAYKLGLTGPTLNIQSACSSSLAAVHMACESLLTYSSDMMLCGAATLGIPQIGGYYYQDNGVLSSDGHLRAFDANATGTLYSDGAGCVVLKRFQDAMDDGDTIYGVIKGSAMNNDGSQKVGFTAPSVKGQVEVIQRAMLAAGVEPKQISYIEAHGTGTPMGDTMELEALHEVFTNNTDKSAFCALGTAKSNFGHTGPAAGVIGLIKTVMALNEKVLPPVINAGTPNSRLVSGVSPFYLNSSPLKWRSEDGNRLAGVSSFGLGGTNVHVILEEPPQYVPTYPGREHKLFLFSAKTESALQKQKSNVQASLLYASQARLADAAYTLQTGRSAFEHRGFFICSHSADFNHGSELDFYRGKCDDFLQPIHFYFPDYSEFAEEDVSEWIERETNFSRDFSEISQTLTQAFQVDIFSMLDEERQMSRRVSTVVAVQISMSRMWSGWGINPSYFEGTGTGLFVAAVAAGLLKLQDAAYLSLCYVMARGCEPDKCRQWIDRYRTRVSKFHMQNLSDSLIFPKYFHATQTEKMNKEASWMKYLSSLLDQTLTTAMDKQVSGKCTVTMGLDPTSKIQNDLNEDKGYSTIGEDMWSRIHKCIGALWVRGYDINWSAYYEGERRRNISLPTYPFERVHCWVDPNNIPQDYPERDQFSQVVPLAPVRLSADELTHYIAPRSGTERVLVYLWEKHLNITPIGIHDNFYELGGSSLLAASLNENICKLFKLNMGLEVFLEHQSIEELAKAMESLFVELIPVEGGR